MNLRYALNNMNSAHPLKFRDLKITLHIHRRSARVTRYYCIESEYGVWNSPMYASCCHDHRSLLDFNDVDPIGDHRAVVNAVIECIQTKAYVTESKQLRSITLEISTRCQYCGANIAHMRKGTRFCNTDHRRAYQNKSNRQAKSA